MKNTALNLKAFIPTAAKAVAMLVAPFVLLVAGWLVNNLGFDLAVPELDQAVTWVTAVLVAVINAVWTYYQRNHPAVPPTEE